MKKRVALLLSLTLCLTLLAACGGGDESEEGGMDSAEEAATIESLETFGDVIALESDETQVAVTETNVVYAFKVGETYYRAIGAISPEDAQAYFEVDFEDEDYETQQNDIIAPFPSTRLRTLPR